MATTALEHLIQAKELVKQRQYLQARALLEVVDHPTAKQWLQQLDKIENYQRPTLGSQYRATTIFIFFFVSFTVILVTATLMRLGII